MLGLEMELRLEQRGADRVVVSVLLAPAEGTVTVEGVALQLHSAQGDAIGARMLLPIAGTLAQPMLSTVELRTLSHDIPQGSRVVGTAWGGPHQLEITLPTDPGTAFEAHVRGHDIVSAHGSSQYLEPLLPDERALFASLFPWIDEPRLPREAAGSLGVVDHEPDNDELVDDFAADMGLDEDSAEWLRDLLDEPD